MQLKIINSNSAGNCYILSNENEALLIECGVQFEKIKQALDFNFKKVVGCLLTHEHGDHAKSVNDVMTVGIDVWASAGTHLALKTDASHRARVTHSSHEFTVGGFKIKAFDVKHDVNEPLGYLINHPECGTVLFMTDTYYCEYVFTGLNNIIIEANYAQDIVDRKVHDGSTKKFLRDRVIESHMSLDTCKKTLATYDLSKVQKIVLIHLSDGNSDSKRFKCEVEEQTGKQVFIANPGLTIDFNKTAF
ncbi:MAG: MBL fold metallo-hydrolase [Chitinophagales bacterium]|nr:MBL fold metallo-hydrolase [Chitinophagales bacterium]MBP9845813.1 MBL fold metallo-hydrolase [Saprospiraceae bacterium]